MARIQAKFFLHGCVLVKDEASIDRLQRSGIGARQLNPIITSVETIDGSLTSAGPLLLLDEEAFYLTHHGSLDVQTSSGEVASLDFLWSAFVNRNTNFAVKYKVFAYYKDKSYVVRTGINFGVDYCAYHTLPSLCHSEMCITVVDATRSASVPSQNTASNASSSVVGANCTANPLNLAWRHVTTLTRVVPDVNKICVICYVLPTGDAPHPPAPETQSVLSYTAAAEEAGMGEDTVSAGSSGGDGEASSGSVHVAAPTVSPYLATLFPTHASTNGATITTATSTTIDHSSHTCLSALTVRPVTALVRRMPALSERYQTIKVIQEVYHAASTAQKKRELKALNKAKVGKIHNGNIGNGSGIGGGGGGGNKEGKKKYNKPYSRVSASAGPTTPSNTTDTLASNTSTITSSVAPCSSIALTNTTTDPTVLLSADPATLSGRQKRIAKYLQKQALQQAACTTNNASSSSALPQSKQMKERRDHRENRTKVMSNKNQSLLNMMQGGGSDNGGGNSGTSGTSGTGGTSGNSGNSGNRGTIGNSGNSGGTGGIGAVDTRGVKDKIVSSGDADTAGVKRPHNDVNTDTADNSYLSGLFHSQDTTTPAVGGAGTSTHPSTTAAPGSGGESRSKRCRTQYAQNTDGEEDASSGYLRRAASYCVIS